MERQMKTTKANPHHKGFRDDLIALLRKHAANLSAQETLAIASHVVGQIIAMQDQRIMTTQMALRLVRQNIERGNEEAMTELLNPKGAA